MRIDRLDLLAYGPFTNRRLDLSKPGVHLILGSNEAGKSTTLAAIHDALFGIHRSSPAAFVHALRDLRIGMGLRHSDGRVFQFVRLKKDKDSLRTSSGDLIPDEEFASFLGRLDRSTFAAMYGIDHPRLRSGGEDLLAGRGELGRALLGAGTGAVNLPATLKDLTDRADKLFKPNGQKPKLNEAITLHQTLARKADEVSLLPSHFTAALQQKEELNRRIAGARDRRFVVSSERNDCQMLLSMLDRIGQRRAAVDRLSELLPVTTRLRYDLAQELKELRARRTELQSAERRSMEQMERFDAQLSNLTPDPAALELEPQVRQMEQAREKYRSDQSSLPSLRAKRAQTLRSAQNRLQRLGLGGDIDKARPALITSVTDAQRVATFTDSERDLRATHQSIQNQVIEARNRIAKRTSELGDLRDVPDFRHLSATVRSLQTQEKLSARRDSVRSGLLRSEAALTGAASKLGLSSLSPAQLVDLPVPDRPTINAVQKQHAELVGRGQALDEQIARLRRARSERVNQLEKLLSGTAIPTIDDLQGSRAERDRQWGLIRTAWLTGHPLQGDQEHAADQYESVVAGSDHLSDQLRDAADVVAARASCESALAGVESELQQATKDLEEHHLRMASFDADWGALWVPVGIRAQAPAEMSDWIDNYTKAVETAAHVLSSQQELVDLDARIANQTSELREVLAGVGLDVTNESTLPTLIDVASDLLDELSQQREQRSALQTTVSELEDQLRDLETQKETSQSELERWEADWRAASASIGLVDLTPNEASAHLNESEQLLAELETLDHLAAQITSLEKSTNSFEVRLRDLAQTLDVADKGLEPLSVLDVLSARCQRAATVHASFEQLSENQTQVSDQLHEEQSGLEDVEGQIRQLLGEASVGSEAELHEAIERSDRLRATEAELQKLDDELVASSSGRTSDQIEQLLADRDGSKLQLVISERDQELKDLDDELSDLNKQLGELTNELKRWDGSSQAADASAEAQMALSEVSTLTEEYLGLQIAVELLQEHMTSYRKKNQGPILARAIPWFERLTCGSFHGLEAASDESGAAILEAIRPSGAAVTVAQMSEGTRDQLYLALRLAAIAESATAGESYPVILDDVLMTFDDARAAAALEVLAELAETTQVIIFAHHHHLGEVAQNAIGSTLTCHAL